MMNLVVIEGRITKDVEVKDVNGSHVADFQVAVEEGSKDHKTVTYIPVTAWKGLADIAHNYAKKGTLVSVVGKMSIRNYTDKDGANRTSTKVVASQLNLLSRAKTQAEQPKDIPASESIDLNAAEMPF